MQSFLLHDAMLVWYMLSSCVHPSVTSRSSAKTARTTSRITQTVPYNSTRILVYWCQRSRRNSNGVIPNGGAK